MDAEDKLERARDLVAFIDAAPTPYHAVAEAARRLTANGFVELDEREEWKITPGTRAFVVRGGGTLLAFVAGSEPPSLAGFVMIGAHTDSPNLRVKPAPELDACGYRQLGVEVYGGVLLSTWLDRDLALAGRVSLATGKSRLLRIDRPLCRIPNLAIHLDREVNLRGLVVNPQTQLVPVLGAPLESKPPAFALRELLAAELRAGGSSDVAADAILGWDLCLYDHARGAIGGVDQEFLFSARLDNLASCHAALEALRGAGDAGAATRVVLLYDHEEVGSQSAIGARSRFAESVLERLADAYPGAGSHAPARAFARSLLVSADMAHAVHPNYADKHDRQHRPQLGRGPVIKINASQAYATDASGAAVFAEACRELGITPQYFVSRNDQPCGSTIGPISAARLGVRTVDVGSPMLSMHSCREMAGTADVPTMIAALTAVLARPCGADSRS
jgi:aspartyl aminopeptidase